MSEESKCFLCRNIGKEITVDAAMIKREQDNICSEHKLQLMPLMLREIIGAMGFDQMINKRKK